MALERFELFLPRNAFSPRDAARAGDVWRSCQDAAVWGASRRGWSPQRFNQERCGFIVRRMTVKHHVELQFGDAVATETWVSSFLRGMITHRQIRMSVHGGPAVSATQEWVFVALTEGGRAGEVRPTRAPPAVVETFVVEDHGPSVGLAPAEPPADSVWHEYSFEAWFGWMDPLGHANHPQYVDWCEEALARAFAPHGVDPMTVVPVAEEVVFRSGVVAPERVTVRTACLGLNEAGDAVFAHRVLGGDGRLCASATLERRVFGGGGDALVAAFLAAAAPQVGK